MGTLRMRLASASERKLSAAEDLETPESGEEDGEDKRDEILCGVELADGQLLGLADGASGLGFGVGMVDLLHA